MAERSPASQARRPARPWRRHLRTTREGKVFIAVTFGVGVAAFNTGNNLMFLVLGFMLSLIVLSGILSELVLRRIEVSRRLPARPHAGRTALIEVALVNHKQRVPSYSLEVEDQVEGMITERRCYFLKVGPGAEQVAAYRRTPERRGYLTLTGFRVATRYPFGIFEKWRIVPAPEEMLVYPALLDTDARIPLPHALGADMATDRVGLGADVVGLRAYQEGDEARTVHWRRTAALGRMVVVERQTDTSIHLTLQLDNARPTDASADSGRAWEAAFEHAISRAATVALDGLARGFAVEVLCRGSRSPVVPSGGTPEPLLRFLALLAPVPAEGAEGFAPRPFRAGLIELSPASRSPGRRPDTRPGQM